MAVVTAPGKHTPGPWVIFADKGQSVAVMPAGRGGDICFLDEGNPVPEREANARLIAAAPELLEVLAYFVAQYDAFRADSGNQADAYYALVKGRAERWDAARAAILKATGDAK